LKARVLQIPVPGVLGALLDLLEPRLVFRPAQFRPRLQAALEDRCGSVDAAANAASAS